MNANNKLGSPLLYISTTGAMLCLIAFIIQGTPTFLYALGSFDIYVATMVVTFLLGILFVSGCCLLAFFWLWLSDRAHTNRIARQEREERLLRLRTSGRCPHLMHHAALHPVPTRRLSRAPRRP